MTMQQKSVLAAMSCNQVIKTDLITVKPLDSGDTTSYKKQLGSLKARPLLKPYWDSLILQEALVETVKMLMCLDKLECRSWGCCLLIVRPSYPVFTYVMSTRVAIRLYVHDAHWSQLCSLGPFSCRPVAASLCSCMALATAQLPQACIAAWH